MKSKLKKYISFILASIMTISVPTPSLAEGLGAEHKIFDVADIIESPGSAEGEDNNVSDSSVVPEFNEAPTVGKTDPYFRLMGVEGEDSYVVENNESHNLDTYYGYGYQSVLINDENADLSNLKPLFWYAANDYFNLYKVNDNGSVLQDPDSPDSITEANQQYALTWKDDDTGMKVKNYWLSVVKKSTGGPKLFVDGPGNGKTREVCIDEYFDDKHDIFVANTGDEPMYVNAYLGDDAKNIKIDDGWKTDGKNSKYLEPFTTTSADSENGELPNATKIRLLKGDDVVSDESNPGGNTPGGNNPNGNAPGNDSPGSDNPDDDYAVFGRLISSALNKVTLPDGSDNPKATAETTVTYEDNTAVYTFDTVSKTITKIELKSLADHTYEIELNIPSSINGTDVEKIATHACDGSTINVTYVDIYIYIPETMVTISKSAFCNFKSVDVLNVMMPKASVRMEYPIFENIHAEIARWACYKNSSADYWYKAGNFPKLFDTLQYIRMHGKGYRDGNMYSAEAYKTPVVQQNSFVRNTDGTLNSVQIAPRSGTISEGSTITISIENGRFDTSNDPNLLNEIEYKSPSYDMYTWDDFYALYNSYGTPNDPRAIEAALKSVGDFDSNRMPYHFESIDSSTLKVQLFPLPAEYVGVYYSDISFGVPTYDIILPAISGNNQGEIRINIDGEDTFIDDYSLVYGYVDENTSDFVKNNNSYIQRNVETQYNTQFENSLIIKPSTTISKDDYIEVKIANGYFDKNLIDNCQYHSAITGTSYDDLYNMLSLYNSDIALILRQYIYNEQSRELPYKLTYIDAQTLGVTLFPLPGRFAGQKMSDVSVGIPVYSISLPAVSGNNTGQVLVAVDGKNTTIKSGGWYTAARINSAPEYEQSDLFFIGDTPDVNAGQKLTDYVDNTLVFEPDREIYQDTEIYINVKNGSFDSSLIDTCMYHAPSTGEDYDMLYDQLLSGRSIESVLGDALNAVSSNEMPYKMEYISEDQLKVTLFPLPGEYAGQLSSTIAYGIPMYKMKLPIVAGEFNGAVEISIDSNNGSTVIPSGWYTAANVINGQDPVTTTETTTATLSESTTESTTATVSESTTETTTETTTSAPVNDNNSIGGSLYIESSGSLNADGTLNKNDNYELYEIKLVGTAGNPDIVTKELSSAVKYVPYQGIVATNNMHYWNDVTYKITGGRLPEGIALNETTGELYGTPQEAGDFTFTLQADFGAEYFESKQQELTLHVLDNTDAYVDSQTDEGFEIIQRIPTIVENANVPLTDQIFEFAYDYATHADEFQGFWYDGEKLERDADYTVEAGSTVITVKSKTISDRGPGKHTVAAEYRTSDNRVKKAAQNFSYSKSGTSTPSGPSSSGSGGGGGGGSRNNSSSYTVSYNSNGGSSVQSQSVQKGSKVTFLATPEKPGYTFAGWYTDKELTKEFDKHKAVTSSFTLYAKWEQVQCTVWFDADGGSEAASVEIMGDTALNELPTSTKEGYKFTGWYTDDEKQFNAGDKIYSNTTLHARWELLIPEKAPDEANGFTDVDENAWYYNDVQWAYSNKYMLGYNNAVFAPMNPMTMSNIATVLAKMTGADVSVFSAAVSGIQEGMWYTPYAKWAANAGLMNNSAFVSDMSLSRENMCIILKKFLDLTGRQADADSSNTEFADSDQISADAKEAIQVLYKLGVLVGKGNNKIDPKGILTRAEFAAFAHRISGLK